MARVEQNTELLYAEAGGTNLHSVIHNKGNISI
jgi:hypothetical protein